MTDDPICPRCDKPVYRGDWDHRCRCAGAMLRVEIEELRDEVRKFQAWIHSAVGDDAVDHDCEWLCQKVCAGPCEGRDVGPLPRRGHE